MKKLLMAIAVLLLAVQSQAQQKKFLNAEGISVMALPASLHYIFETPGMYTTYTCYPEDLDSAANYNMAQLTNLQVLHIQFALDPESDNTVKQLFIDTLLQHLQALKYFKACPSLNKIVLGVGEQIFITRAEADKLWKGDSYNKMSQLNLQNAWGKLGARLQAIIPGKKLYAYNWGW